MLSCFDGLDVVVLMIVVDAVQGAVGQDCPVGLLYSIQHTASTVVVLVRVWVCFAAVVTATVVVVVVVVVVVLWSLVLYSPVADCRVGSVIPYG